MQNPLRPFLYVEDNYLRIKTYTSQNTNDPTFQYTTDNNIVKINKSFKSTYGVTIFCVILSAILMTIHYTSIELHGWTFYNIMITGVLGLIAFLSFGMRPFAESMGQRALDHLLAGDVDWLEAHYRVAWHTFEGGYYIMTSEEAEKKDIENMTKKSKYSVYKSEKDDNIEPIEDIEVEENEENE